MNAIITTIAKNVAAVLVVAATTYCTVLYAVDNSTTISPTTTPMVIDSPILPTCQELYSNNMEIKSCTGRVEAIPQQLVDMVCDAPKYEGTIDIKFNGAVVRCYR